MLWLLLAAAQAQADGAREPVGESQAGAVPEGAVEGVHVVTVCSDDADASALIQSARLAGIDLIVLGVGIPMPWPTGLRTKIMLVKEFVDTASVGDNDLIVFVDAWDTMVLAESSDTLRQGFIAAEKKVGRPIIFAPEEYCYPQDKDTKDTLCAYFDKLAPDIEAFRLPTPPGASSPFQRHAGTTGPWTTNKRRYLNSGLYAGRRKDFKTLFSAPIPDKLPLSDQPWFQKQFRDTNLIGLDYEQRFFAAHPFDSMAWFQGGSEPPIGPVSNSGGDSQGGEVDKRSGGRGGGSRGRWYMADKWTFARPAVVHWNGPAHWCQTEGGGFSYNFINGYQRAAIRVVGWWHAPLHCDALQVLELIFCWGGSVLGAMYVAFESGGSLHGIRRKLSMISQRRRMGVGLLFSALCCVGYAEVAPYYVQYHVVNAINMRNHVEL